MLKSFRFYRLATLTIALATPGLLLAGANTWTGASPSGATHQRPALVAIAESDPSQVYAAYDSALYRSHDGGRSWSLVATFDFITAISVHPVTPSTVFVGGRRGSLAGFFRSDDGGASWRQSPVSSQDVLVRSFAMSAKAPSRMYALADAGLCRSDDGGGSWQAPPRHGNTLSGAVAALLLDPRDGKTVWAGGYDEDFDYDYAFTTTPFLRWSNDGAESWASATPGFPVRGKLQSIAIDPTDLRTIFVGFDGQAASLLRSRDSGITWQLAQTGLPRHARVISLAIDPRKSGVVYAGTLTGVFQTRNGGESWVSMSQQLSPSTIVASLVMGGRILHAGTSRGVFDLEVGEGAVDVAGEAGQTRLLDWKQQRLSIRTSPESAAPLLTPEEGPFPGWSAAGMSDGPDGRSRVLWVNGDGRASLEIAGTSGAEANFQYAALEHSAAIDVAASGDGGASLLWTSDKGAGFIATVDPTGAATLGPRYGPYPGWSPVAIAEGADGFTWALWRGTDGSVGISMHRAQVLWAAFVFVSAPNAGWSAEDIAAGADGRPRVLRVHADGRASVSTLDAQGLLSGEQISSNEGFRARRISAGPDGSTLLLWTSADGDDDVWTLNADNTRRGGP